MTIARPWGQPEHQQNDVMQPTFACIGYDEIPTHIFGNRARSVIAETAADDSAESSGDLASDYKEFLHSMYDSNPKIVDRNDINEKFFEGVTVMFTDYFRGLKIFAEALIHYTPSAFLERLHKILEVGIVLGKFKETIVSKETKAFTKAAIRIEIQRLLVSKGEEEKKLRAGRLFNMTRIKRGK